MKLTVKRKDKNTADGTYTVKAPGCILAQLYWADEKGALENYTAFGVVPLDGANGVGNFTFAWERAIPEEVTHILLRGVSYDLKTYSEELFPFEYSRDRDDSKVLFRATVLSDLHTTNKAGILKRALETARGSDCLLMTGDMTNDGTDEEFALLRECLRSTPADLPVYEVVGNHDLLSKGESTDVLYEKFGEVDLIGINATEKWDTIMPVTKSQLEKVQNFLKGSGAKYHIVMIHTPLTRNMPVRNAHLSRYISCDKELQGIIDSYSNVIVLSGHTHLSPCLDSGTVSRDADRNNIYINCGSIRPTELGHESLLAPKEWAEGNNVELILKENSIEIRMKQIHGGKYISRGHYFFKI